MKEYVKIDGSQGEGGGQMLRTSLAMSAVTGRPFEMVNVRAKRDAPGLKRQHLTCLRAAGEICGAEIEGDEVGSLRVSFRPGPVKAGDYRFEIGTAGSVTLVAQTVLPILLCAAGESTVRIAGGTHVPMSPCWEYFAGTFLPQLRRMGAEVEARLVTHGFYPAGGGEVVLNVKPWKAACPYVLTERGAFRSARALARVANLPLDIAACEAKTVASLLPSMEVGTDVAPVASMGPGNYCALEMAYGDVTFVASEIGVRNRSRKAVANGVATAARSYLKTGAAVDTYLSDQLLLPIVLAGRNLSPTDAVWGRFSMPRHRSLHFDTNWAVLQAFLPDIEMTIGSMAETDRRVEVRIGRKVV